MKILGPVPVCFRLLPETVVDNKINKLSPHCTDESFKAYDEVFMLMKAITYNTYELDNCLIIVSQSIHFVALVVVVKYRLFFITINHPFFRSHTQLTLLLLKADKVSHSSVTHGTD